MRKEIDVDATQQPYVIIIPEFIAHAVVNRSDTTGYIFHYSNKPYTIDRAQPCQLL